MAAVLVLESVNASTLNLSYKFGSSQYQLAWIAWVLPLQCFNYTKIKTENYYVINSGLFVSLFKAHI
jgi:hypothetical protein